jgi:transcriptional regulator with XRE-family HTH domain
MSFGNQLRAAREDSKMTQQQVADFLGINKSTYSGYETGKREPDVARIKALADLFSVSGDLLLETGFTEEKEEPAGNVANGLDIPDALINVIDGLNEQGVDALTEYGAFLFSKSEYKAKNETRKMKV